MCDQRALAGPDVNKPCQADNDQQSSQFDHECSLPDFDRDFIDRLVEFFKEDVEAEKLSSEDRQELHGAVGAISID